MDTARAGSHRRALTPHLRSRLGRGSNCWFLPVSGPYCLTGLTHQVSYRPLRGSLSRQPTAFSSLRVSAAHDYCLQTLLRSERGGEP
jgi:hypothetical protein